MATFGRLLRQARSQAERSMGELARHLGVSVVYVSDVENGNRPPFTKERVLSAAEYLKTDVEPLLAAAAKTRGVFELDARKVSQKAQEGGAALMRGWPDLTDEELEGIEEIVGRSKQRGRDGSQS